MTKRHQHRYYMPVMQRLFWPREGHDYYDEDGKLCHIRGGQPRRGTENRRIVAKGEAIGREFYLHATKGYRSYRG